MRALREEGRAIPAIATTVGRSVRTVYYHLAEPAPEGGEAGEVRTLLTLLGCAGPRIGEALALRNLRRAATIAIERREARGLPPLPRVTPHTLRDTYISIRCSSPTT